MQVAVIAVQEMVLNSNLQMQWDVVLRMVQNVSLHNAFQHCFLKPQRKSVLTWECDCVHQLKWKKAYAVRLAVSTLMIFSIGKVSTIDSCNFHWMHRLKVGSLWEGKICLQKAAMPLIIFVKCVQKEKLHSPVAWHCLALVFAAQIWQTLKKHGKDHNNIKGRVQCQYVTLSSCN